MRGGFPQSAAIDGRFEILDCNAGFVGLMQQLGLAQAMAESGAEQTRSLLAFIFADGPNRALIDNWAEVAGHMITRLKADAWRQGPSGTAQVLLDDAVRQPGMEAVMRAVEASSPQPLIPIRLRVGDMVSSWITPMTSFGAPNDAYVEELSIEQFHPADEQTERLMRQLATSHPQ